MIILVSPSFLKQKAKKLKKGLGISHHEALDKAAKEFGFFNFRHFLNFSEKSKTPKERALKTTSVENGFLPEAPFEIPSPNNPPLSFFEQLDILKLFQHSEDIQSTCKKWNLMKNEINTALFNEFLTEQGEHEIQFRHPYFVAKEISLNDLWYEIKEEHLCVDGEYNLKIRFDGEVLDECKDEPHCKDRLLSGSFGIKISKNEEIAIPHLNIVEIMDGTVYAGTLKPIARLFPAFQLR